MKRKNGARRKSPHFTSPVSYLCSAGFTRSQASALLKKGPEGLTSEQVSRLTKRDKYVKAMPSSVSEVDRLRSQNEQLTLTNERERGRVEGLETAIRLYAHTVRRED